MKIENVMTTAVVFVHPDETDARAAQLMWTHDCGSLPVVDDEERVVGMITDRDICMASFAKGNTLGDLRVRDAMSKEVVACRPSDSLEMVMSLMGEHQLHRLPVVDERHHLLGIVTVGDVLREASEARGKLAAAELSLLAVEALAHVHTPRWCEGVVAPERPELAHA